MLKAYQFKTHCKGDSHSSKTANIILPGLMIKQRWTSLRLQAKYSIQLQYVTEAWQTSYAASQLISILLWNNTSWTLLEQGSLRVTELF